MGAAMYVWQPASGAGIRFRFTAVQLVGWKSM